MGFGILGVPPGDRVVALGETSCPMPVQIELGQANWRPMEDEQEWGYA